MEGLACHHPRIAFSNSVPNNDIGGSGVMTCLLDLLAAYCQASCRTWAFVLFCALSGLLRTRASSRRETLKPSRGAQPRSSAKFAGLRPLGECARVTAPPLEWRSPLGHPRRRKGLRGFGISVKFWFWLLFLLRTPQLAWAAPEGLDTLLAVAAASSNSTAIPEHLPVARSEAFAGRALLGVQVLAPHYHTAYTEVPLTPTEGRSCVIRAAEAIAQTSFHRDFSVVVPCKPQLFDGFASVVAQPATGYVVVVLDLHAVQGNRFACVLPRSISDAALRAFVASPTQLEEEVDVVVGDEREPRPEQADMRLIAGDVISVLPRGHLPPLRLSLAELCGQRATWGASDQFPRPLLKAGICLIHGTRRFFVNQRQFPGQPPAEVAARTVGIRRDTPFLKIANDALDNVLLHGNICRGVACVVDIPGPGLTETAEPARDDNVCFFDVRPLGRKPVCHYQIGELRHIPTVLDHLGIYAPSGFKLVWDQALDDGFARVPTGRTITVSVVPIDPSAAAADDLPSDPQDPADDEDDSDDSEGSDDCLADSDADGDRGSLGPQQARDVPAAPASPRRPRSRSPRRYGGAGCSVGAFVLFLPFLLGTGFADKWAHIGHDEHCPTSGSCVFTSVDDGPGHSRGGNDTVPHECRALLATPASRPCVSLALVACCDGCPLAIGLSCPLQCAVALVPLWSPASPQG